MKPVYTYKALSQSLMLYGFRSFDFFVVIIVPALVGITINYLLGALCLIILWVAAKKLKSRPPGYFSSLFLFVVTPEFMSVRMDSDIPHYLDILNNADKSNVA